MKADRTSLSTRDTSLEREIEAIVSVEPSSEFVSRVRARVTGKPVPVWTTGWTSLAAGSVVVAVFVAVVISNPHDMFQQEALAPTAATSRRVDTVFDDEPTSPNLIPMAREGSRRRPSQSVFREPEMLILPEEAAAMRHFPPSLLTEPTELSFMTIEPQPLPQFIFLPPPVLEPMASLQGDFK